MAAVALLVGVSSAHAAAPSYCRAIGTDDTIRPITPELAPAAIAAFHVHMKATEVARTGVMRCVDGEAFACLTGANLTCGKADKRTRNSGGDAWCEEHPDADFIPAFATGHATVYAWRCKGRLAVVVRQVQQVDGRGFVAENWRRVTD
jgi:hypothetical protein